MFLLARRQGDFTFDPVTLPVERYGNTGLAFLLCRAD